jgi:hypothetical protein
VLQQLFRIGVEDNHFPNRGRQNRTMSLNDGMQVQIAYWATRESPKLQMHDLLTIGDTDALGMDRKKLTSPQDCASRNMAHRLHLCLLHFVEHHVR